METQIAELEGKLKTLNFRLKKTGDVLKKDDRTAFERHKVSVEALVTTVVKLKDSIEEQKFTNGEDDEAVQEWADEIELVINEGDACIRELEERIEQIDRNLKHATVLYEHKREVELEKEKMMQQQEAINRAHAEELEFEKKKLELKQVQAEPPENMHGQMASNVVRMPKLVITKFDGTPQDWLRFWGQFQSQIDDSSAPEVTKFSYLKELVNMKVRNLIDGLPFTPEGYQKAKDLLTRRYGKASEVVGTYVRNILELPTMRERNVKKIHEFYEVLLFNVESLRTLKSLSKLDAAVRFTFDKLEVIKNELAMIDEKWCEWTFVAFLEALEKWTTNNPISDEPKSKSSNFRRDQSRAFLAKQQETGNQSRASPGACLYCCSEQHKAINCENVQSIEERKKILADKRLCFNCTGAKHRANDCKSRNTCKICDGKRHTSICDRKERREPGMTANLIDDSSVVHPVVVINMGGYKFRALLDSGASHSYVSSTAIELLKAKVKSTSLRQIAMLTGVETRTMQVYEVVMHSVTGDFSLNVNVTKIEKRELLTLDNPKYSDLVKNHPHLRGVKMDDSDTKARLPVHVIIGANDFAKIRTSDRLRVGRKGDPVAERTRFGWTIMSPGTDLGNAYLAVNSTVDHNRLCAPDVLGLEDKLSTLQSDVHEEFKEQLARSPDGRYETGLPWKGNCPELPNNCAGSVRRVNSLLRKLKRTDMLDQYDDIIREQLEESVVEKAPAKVTGKEFYMPHRAVIRENAESTKLRVVYDASARAYDGAPSLNECLHTGPPLQNELWNVIVRNRFHPIAVAGDVRNIT